MAYLEPIHPNNLTATPHKQPLNNLRLTSPISPEQSQSKISASSWQAPYLASQGLKGGIVVS